MTPVPSKHLDNTGDRPMPSNKKCKQVLTVGDVEDLHSRIDEIDEIIELCDPHWDADVIGNLQTELDQIAERVNRSLATATRNYLRSV